MASIKSNLILNGINTVTSVLFPVITFPYAARVLLPEGIGVINFLNSIIAYIVLFTSLGIPLYAVKEVAKCHDEKQERDRVTIEILLLSFILCVIGYLIVWMLAEFVPQIHANYKLFYVLSLTIIFSAIGVNWFYQGIEDFKFITIRAVIIRVVAAASLFIFVHSPKDLLIYGLIIVGSTVGNNFVNFIHLRSFISFRNISLKQIRISRHIQPALKIFTFNLITSLYLQLNSVMLGFMSSDEAVGYFTAGNKISNIALTMIASIGTVLLPRCSHLLKSGNLDEFSKIIKKSLNLTSLLVYPITAGLIVLASPVVLVFCGAEFQPAVPVLIITAPIIVFVSYTSLMGLQILYPKDKINLVIYSVAGGAIINIILNILLIPHLAAVGVAFATLIAQLSVWLLQIILGKNYYPFRFSAFLNYKAFISTILMSIGVYIVSQSINSPLLKVLFGTISGVIIYTLCLVIFKENLFLSLVAQIKKQIR